MTSYRIEEPAFKKANVPDEIEQGRIYRFLPCSTLSLEQFHPVRILLAGSSILQHFRGPAENES